MLHRGLFLPAAQRQQQIKHRHQKAHAQCREDFFQHSISFLFKQTTQRVAQALIQRLRAPVHLGAVGAVERACKLALLGLG